VEDVEELSKQELDCRTTQTLSNSSYLCSPFKLQKETARISSEKESTERIRDINIAHAQASSLQP